MTNEEFVAEYRLRQGLPVSLEEFERSFVYDACFSRNAKKLHRQTVALLRTIPHLPNAEMEVHVDLGNDWALRDRPLKRIVRAIHYKYEAVRGYSADEWYNGCSFSIILTRYIGVSLPYMVDMQWVGPVIERTGNAPDLEAVRPLRVSFSGTECETAEMALMWSFEHLFARAQVEREKLRAPIESWRARECTNGVCAPLPGRDNRCDTMAWAS